MRLVLLVVTAALLGGCALDLSGAEWTKPDATFQQLTAAELECARRAFQITPGPDLVLGGLLDVLRLAAQEMRQQAAFSDCMTSGGYARAE